ncbi:MAG: hypothetical protein ACKOBG_11280 [Actinomycetota bacterium]
MSGLLDRLLYGLAWALLIVGFVVIAMLAIPFLILLALFLIPVLVVFGL